ncbi:hypothetical protein CEP54_015659 [Fusarium duplospermum]|uniref:NADP-dependent oxidoreductase domain-containing protein n=1 Tax=Fusarium duplospermum TaxID=1325734 RepID=A0A428NMF5_9HYPO|nr:hypothetical protein CEP54_015659 [Fusarium duplospermum]
MIRDFEREIIPMARHFGMALSSWDVLGSGKVQGRKQVEERKKSGEPLRSLVSGDSSQNQTENEIRMSEELATMVAELVLVYVMAIAPNVFARQYSVSEDNVNGEASGVSGEREAV